MNWNTLLIVFGTVFLAELGDKTQLATLLFATNKEVSRLTIFIGASLALILTSGIGVLAGSFLSNLVDEKHLSIAEGIGFIAIGLWTLIKS